MGLKNANRPTGDRAARKSISGKKCPSNSHNSVDGQAATYLLHHQQIRVDPVAVFVARAEARALLWQAGEFNLHEAVDLLQRDAERDGLVAEIGQDVVQHILAEAFGRVR